MTTVLETGQKLYGAYYYDYDLNRIQERHTTVNGKTQVYKSSFNFSRQILSTAEEYGNEGALKKMYTYDHMGRLTNEVHIVGNDSTKFAYSYDDAGRLIQLARQHGEDVLTSTNEYNVRSWLKAIKSPLFSQTLFYTDGTGTPCYNGNISSMSWKTGSASTLRGYNFKYDGLNRMTDALYGEGNALTANAHRFDEQVTGYDKMGNILGLKRQGQTSQTAYGLIDNLSMVYDGNKLQSVNDNAASSAYNSSCMEFKDGAKKTVEYTYDTNGNLTEDLNKNITGIRYNYLNLPSQIQFKDGASISYLYDANGTKLRTKHVIAGVATTTDYCGSAIYENGVLSKWLTGKGYVSLQDNAYHYYLQDHQGNNRVVASRKGVAEEVNHYYPFGGVFATSASVQPYKYNGKELDTKKGLNWYDYGARRYDAAIGRFMSTDPMAEKYYPWASYVYCNNNPMRFIDPTGCTWWDKVKGFISSTLDNATGGIIDLRTIAAENVSDTFDFNEGLTAGDVASIALSALEISAGGGMIDSGTATTVVGLAAEGSSLGVSSAVVAVGGAEVIAGATLTAHGTLMMSNAGKNLLERKGHIEHSSTETSTNTQKGTLTGTKKALKEVHDNLGGSLPKGTPGKNGSPQRGNSKKGYRLDPGHPGRPADSPENGPHINWWDYSNGKKGSGGKWGAVPIK